MTPAKRDAKLQGQTAIARKVYEVVPIQEAWSANEIMTALQRTTRSSMDFKIMHGCLRALRDSGLINEPKLGMFQRVSAKEAAAEFLNQKTPTPAKEMKSTASTSPAAPALPKQSAIELLQEIGTRAAQLASDVQVAVAMIEEEMATQSADLAKLAQLQTLLRGLA